MSASTSVSLENSLLGLSLIEGMLDPAREGTYELLLAQYGPDELVDLMIQFGMQWLAYESRRSETPMTEYLTQLRTHFIEWERSKATSGSSMGDS